MAIHYCSIYSRDGRGRNFGDDINPFLLGKLFDSALIESDDVCLVGIGTIIGDDTTQAIGHYRQKVVFTSGVGYYDLEHGFDDSWDFVCVRGPNTARKLGLPAERGICDGAILLADVYPPRPQTERSGTVFIPHVNSTLSSEAGLKEICTALGLTYLSPSAPFEAFIDTVRSAALVMAEAMHGAILADALRTPWIPLCYFHHNRFKWEDWLLSIERSYECHAIGPAVWDEERQGPFAPLFLPLRQLKIQSAKRRIKAIRDHVEPILSDESVIDARKAALRARVADINRRYVQACHGPEERRARDLPSQAAGG